MTRPRATNTATATPSTTPRKAVASRATSQTAKSGRLTCRLCGMGRERHNGWTGGGGRVAWGCAQKHRVQHLCVLAGRLFQVKRISGNCTGERAATQLLSGCFWLPAPSACCSPSTGRHPPAGQTGPAPQR